MRRADLLRYAGWALLLAAAVFFVQNGIQKLTGTEPMVQLFAALGYPGWVRYGVGVVEIVGGACLLVPRLKSWAAAALGGLMAGAAASELRAGHSFEVLIPMQWLVFFRLVVWLHSRRRRYVDERPA